MKPEAKCGAYYRQSLEHGKLAATKAHFYIPPHTHIYPKQACAASQLDVYELRGRDLTSLQCGLPATSKLDRKVPLANESVGVMKIVYISLLIPEKPFSAAC